MKYCNTIGRLFVDWSPDSTMLVALSGLYANVIEIWNVNTNEVINNFTPDILFIDSIEWSSDGLKIAIVSEFETTEIWHVYTNIVVTLE